MKFKYCPYCGASLQGRPAKGGLRSFCPDCGKVFYRNPTVGVAVVLVEDEKILLVRRKGSYGGQWCIPCGHVEWDEEVERTPPGASSSRKPALESILGGFLPFTQTFTTLNSKQWVYGIGARGLEERCARDRTRAKPGSSA